VHLLQAVEELMPSIGTIVPPPAVLATTVWQSESIFRNIDKLSQDLAQTQSSHSVISDTNSDKNVYQGAMSYITSISEDGKIWSWHLTFDDKSADSKKINLGANQYSQYSRNPIAAPTVKSTDDSVSVTNVGKEPGTSNHSDAGISKPRSKGLDFTVKVVV
jgi:hypothetical protein